MPATLDSIKHILKALLNIDVSTKKKKKNPELHGPTCYQCVW